MTARARVLLAAALSLSLATAAACGTTATPATSGGGVLTVGTSAQPDCLDPAVSALDATAVADRGVFDSLVSMTAAGAFEPWLAQRWTISSDGRTYTFFLRGDVRFADGSPLTAAVVKASLDHVVDPRTKSKYAAGLIRRYAGAEAVDDTTVRVSLSAPDASFLDALSTPYLGIQSIPSLRRSAAELCASPVGSGPFEFVSWTRNVNLVLKRNPAYRWGPATMPDTGPARLDGVNLMFIPENSARFGVLTSGQAQLVDDLLPSQAKALRNSDGLQLLRAVPPGAVYSLFFNITKGPLADERVRRALLSAVDIDQLVKAIYLGQYQSARSLLSPSTIDYTAAAAPAYDPVLAGRLLDQAGWTGRDAEGYRTRDGVRLTLSWPYAAQRDRDQRSVLAQGIQAEAKQAGIDLAFTEVDVGAYSEQVLQHRTADMFAVSFERADPDILRYLLGSTSTPAQGGGNAFRVSDPQLDGWLNAADAATDTAVRRQNYIAAQRYLADHVLTMPLYVPLYLAGASARLHGVSFEPDGYTSFYGAWLAAS